jgi:hypothetical protein
MGGLFSQLALKKDRNNTLTFLETRKQKIHRFVYEVVFVTVNQQT